MSSLMRCSLAILHHPFQYVVPLVKTENYKANRPNSKGITPFFIKNAFWVVPSHFSHLSHSSHLRPIAALLPFFNEIRELFDYFGYRQRPLIAL